MKVKIGDKTQMNPETGGFLVPMQGLADFHKNIADSTLELVQVYSEWECEGLTVWQFQPKGHHEP